MKSLKIRKYDLHIFLNSIVIALVCSSNLLFYLIMYFLRINQGFFLIIGTTAGLLLLSLILYRSISKNDFFAIGFLLGLVVMFYLISAVLGRIGDISFVSFTGYCVFPIICSTLKKNTKIILETIMIISLFVLPVTSQLFEYQYVTLLQVDMSKAYAVFVTISASFIHFFWYRKNSNLFIKMIYIVNLYYLYKLLNVGNRGLIASIVFLIFAMLIRYTRNNNISAKKKMIMTVLIAIFCVVIVVFILNIERIIVYLYKYFSSTNGTVPSFVVKMYNLIVYKSDITNGRDEVYIFFISKTLSNPVIGYGMDMSGTVSGGLYPYPHNYILQLLFEGGIIFAAYPSIISIKMVISTLFKIQNDKDYEAFSLFLLCNCIPKLLLSGDIWNQSILWIWLGTAALQFARRRDNNEKQPV